MQLLGSWLDLAHQLHVKPMLYIWHLELKLKTKMDGIGGLASRFFYYREWYQISTSSTTKTYSMQPKAVMK
jgi:hypothetical protein